MRAEWDAPLMLVSRRYKLIDSTIRYLILDNVRAAHNSQHTHAAMELKRLSARYMASDLPTLPDKWVTSVSAGDIDRVMRAPHESSDSALCQLDDNCRPWSSSGAHQTTILYIAHRECNTVYWIVDREEASGALHFRGHFWVQPAPRIGQLNSQEGRGVTFDPLAQSSGSQFGMESGQ